MQAPRRIRYHRYGGPDVLRLEEFEPPTLRRGEVLVRVRAAAVNGMDGKIRRGELRAMTGRRFRRGLGYDFAGLVEGIGEGVSRVRVGDSVLGAADLRRAGAFADVVADEGAVVAKPDSVSFAQAAALPVVGVTALQVLGSGGRAGRGSAVRRTRGSPAGVYPVVRSEFDPGPLAHQFDLVLDTAGGRIVDIVPSTAKFARSLLASPYALHPGRPDLRDLEAVACTAGRGELTVPTARTVPLHAAIVGLETEGTPRGGQVVVVMR